MALRIASIVMLILLLLSIAVQFNDPDPWAWVFIYGFATVPTIFAIARTWTGLSVLAAIGYYIGFVMVLPDSTVRDPTHIFTDLQMGEAGVEEAREAGGMLFCAIWMTVLSVVWWRNRNRSLVK